MMKNEEKTKRRLQNDIIISMITVTIMLITSYRTNVFSLLE